MRKTAAALLLVAAALSRIAASAAAGSLSLSGSNRLEYGLARMNGDETFEDLFRLDAARGPWSAGVRLHLTQPSEGAAADSLDQRYLGYGDDHLDILAGTFYETWGRGLLLRAYENRGAVVDRVERSISLDRDIDGVRVVGRTGPGTLTLLSGRPRVTSLSGEPDLGMEIRRDRLRGARLEVDPADFLSAGGAYLRINGPDGSGGSIRDEFSSLDAIVRAAHGDLYVEAARREPIEELLTPSGHALYASASGFAGPFGLSWEYKNYRRFQSLYNEPPTLVTTHSWTLLNRETHIATPDDETGHEVQFDWSTSPEGSLVLGQSRSDNHAREELFAFREWYLEARQHPGPGWPRLRGIVDYAEDPLKGDDHRRSAALEVEIPVDALNSVTVTGEWLEAVELFAPTDTHRLVQVEYQRSPWLTVALLGENASQPEEGRDTWASITVNLNLEGRHNLNLFYGRRPAGTLCAGGYCFLASGFDGLEIRLLSRF